MVGSAGNAAVRRFRFCFVTPDLQAGNRITSRNYKLKIENAKLVAGVGVTPT